jgi:hypothetical protein
MLNNISTIRISVPGIQGPAGVSSELPSGLISSSQQISELQYLQLTNSAIIYEPFLSESVSFTKSDYGDEVDEIDENFSITRGEQRGIYNPILEEGWDTDFPYTSPSGSLWNADGWGDLKDTARRSYTTFYEALGGNIGENVVGTELILHDTINDKYYAVKFSNWTKGQDGGGSGGGGFSYTRQQINTSNYFFKPDNDTDTIDVFVEDDGGGSGIGITRDENGGIYNPYREEGWDSDVSPSGTLWNVDGWGDFSDLTDRTYQPFYAAFGYGGLGNNVVGTECVMYIPETGEYYAIKFLTWAQNNQGGGFSYVRYPIDLTQLNEGVKFADGSTLKTAKNLTNTKGKFPKNRKIVEDVGYVDVSISERIFTDVGSTVTVREGIDTDLIWLANSDSLAQFIVNGYSGIYSDIELSFDEQTWYKFSGGSNLSGADRGIRIDDASVSYSLGDTVYVRTGEGGNPVIWFNGRGDNFRGAVIDLHAYSQRSGTIIGTIWISRDSGRNTISHIETKSGNDSNIEDLDLWFRFDGNERRIYARRLDNESDRIKIQWIAKLFYGSEYYD